MANPFFTGFSTLDSEKSRTRTFYDLELCKRDLMNQFYTRPGERVMRPLWGCRIWDLLMEQFTSGIKEMIVDEATSVVEADPRCQIVKVEVNEFDQGIIVQITMNFIPQAVVDTFAVEFDRRDASFFS